MSRFLSTVLAGTATLGLLVATTETRAAPMPAMSAVAVGTPAASVETVRYRGRAYGGGYGRRGYGGGYGRRGYGGGALAAGAALGIIGGAIAASQAPRYGYYDRGYYEGGYPAYGYAAPAYGYGYPAYGYGY